MMKTEPQNTSLHEVIIIRSVSEKIRSLLIQRSEQQTAIVKNVSGTISLYINEWGKDLYLQLKKEVKECKKTGWPPSFIHLAGESRLEKPFNRLLAWWADEKSEHGLAKEFLKKLVKRIERIERIERVNSVDFDTMVNELEHGKFKVHPEKPLEGTGSGKEPDLVIETEHAVLLLENKVAAPESGDQYGPYLELLSDYAKERGYIAILCARNERETPPGWDGFISHEDIGEIFYELTQCENASTWGKIAALITFLSFTNDFTDYENFVSGQKIVSDIDANNGQIKLKHFLDMRRLLPLSEPPKVWE